MRMQKRVFVIHGWESHPKDGWFPWLKKELVAAGFKVFVPQLPKPDEPKIKNWVPKLNRVVGKPDAETYFVGHSLGCQTIVRYLEALPEGVMVGGAVFVGGFFKRLTGLEGDEEKNIAYEWLKTPIDLKKAKTHLKKSVAIFSDDDPFVPLDNEEDFKNILGSKIVIEHGKKHFAGYTGTIELPATLQALHSIAKYRPPALRVQSN